MAEDEIVRYSNLDEYIVNNSFLANNTYIKYINIKIGRKNIIKLRQ